MRLRVEGSRQLLQLARSLSLALANDALHLSARLVEGVHLSLVLVRGGPRLGSIADRASGNLSRVL
jgi:hypothetical protein